MKVSEVQYKLPTLTFNQQANKRFEGLKPYQRIVVDQNIDWLYDKIYLLIMQESITAQKEYAIASCDIGKCFVNPSLTLST